MKCTQSIRSISANQRRSQVQGEAQRNVGNLPNDTHVLMVRRIWNGCPIRADVYCWDPS